jgi:hypothetical protein
MWRSAGHTYLVGIHGTDIESLRLNASILEELEMIPPR